jgi:hypothetical protein
LVSRLDIEGEQYWGNNIQKNRNFFLGLVNATLAHHQELGNDLHFLFSSVR